MTDAPLTPHTVLRPADLALDPDESAPLSASRAVTTLGGLEIGVWEMAPGSADDVEAEEVFVVLSGRGSIEFLDEARTITVGPGDLVRLEQGARTRWSIQETLRKLYLTQAG